MNLDWLVSSAPEIASLVVLAWIVRYFLTHIAGQNELFAAALDRNTQALSRVNETMVSVHRTHNKETQDAKRA